MDSTKVFIDTDNEITFILEKILSAKSERVSLVIPDRASVFSSITGLKLIRRVVDKSNKLLVLVTLDDQGAELSRNAGLMVVSRVGEINETVWEKALKEKFEVKKRDARSHYMPAAVEPEQIEESVIEESEPVTAAEIIESIEEDLDTIGRNTDEKPGEYIPEEESSQLDLMTDENQAEPEASPVVDVPQVRINIKMDELKEADAELPEAQETMQVIDEPPMPSFLTREVPPAATLRPFDAPDHEDLLQDEEHVEDIRPNMHNDKASESAMHANENENIRRRRASTRGTGISNLKFSVGKDIDNEKKK